MLWKTYDEWAATISSWAASQGWSDEVVLLDDLHSGEDVRGTGTIAYICTHQYTHTHTVLYTELQGVDRLILLKALRILEGQGKARYGTTLKQCASHSSHRLFMGSSPEEEGVKFF